MKKVILRIFLLFFILLGGLFLIFDYSKAGTLDWGQSLDVIGNENSEMDRENFAVFKNKLYFVDYDRVYRQNDSGNWDIVRSRDDNINKGKLFVFKNKLYLYGQYQEGRKFYIYRTSDGNSWERVSKSFTSRGNDGFCTPIQSYYYVASLYAVVYKDKIYSSVYCSHDYAYSTPFAGTWSSVDGESWVAATDHLENRGMRSRVMFNNELYYLYFDDFNTYLNNSIYKYKKDVDRGEVVYNGGFGDRRNISPGVLEVFKGYLYVSTYNIELGTEIWRSKNGTSWSKVKSGGFGDSTNRSVSSMVADSNYLYAATWNFATGTEVWRTTNGTNWKKVNNDGFGNIYNSNATLSLHNNQVNAYVRYKSNSGNTADPIILSASSIADGDTSSSGGIYDERTDSSTGKSTLVDLNPKILTSSGPGEPVRLQAYARNQTDDMDALLSDDITGLFPDSYTGGAGIVPIDQNNNTVLDQFLIFAINNGGPQARVMGLKSDGSLSSLGQMFVFDSSIRDGLSATTGDFDNDGYKDDAAFCLTGDKAPTVRVYTDVTGIDNWNLLNEFTAPFGNVGCNLGTFRYDGGGDDLLVTPNHGPADPNVYIYWVNGDLKKQFMAYPEGVQSGLTPSGIGDRIYTTPNNGSSQINGFDREGNRKSFWWAYAEHVRGDFKNVPGDIDLDGKAELLISPIGQNGPQVLSFESTGKWRTFPNFFAFGDPTLRNGVGIAVVENWHGIN